ncbi:MAG: uroporphyrinogen-III synthase [Rhodanobacter sp.]
MQTSATPRGPGLAGREIVITRPAGTARALVRRVRALGGTPVLLPGLALRGPTDTAAARAGLREALGGELVIFTSPAAVDHAVRLTPLHTLATVLAVGQGTAIALRRHGVREPLVPSRQDSEGLLDHPVLRDVRGRRVALVGAPGGRGLLRHQLAVRGAHLLEVQVYRRVTPRLDQRHAAAVLRLSPLARVLLSSDEALQNVCRLLPSAALAHLLTITAVASSARLAESARRAGFGRVALAASALAEDLLAAAAR